MPSLKDLTGRRFGKWVVKWPVGRKTNGIFWLCLCDCGTFKPVIGSCLTRGKSKKCTECKTTHGLSYTYEYKMWGAAHWRAKREKVPFSISPSDISIPDRCVLLDIPLIAQKNRMSVNSPSLDKIIPELGYVVGNIQVISQRANLLKSNSTLEELRRLVVN